MSVSPPYLSPGVDAWADGAADVDGAPSAEQLAAWFAHPSAGLDDMPWTKDARCVDVAPGAEDARCVEVVPQDAYSRGVDCEAGGATVADPNADAVPGWVELEWLAAPIRPEVRALMRLAPGPALLTALASLPAGPCPADHSDLAFGVRPLPGSTPGFACACQLVVAAGWDSMATWTGTSAAVHLVDIAGRDLVTVLPEGAPVAARSVDPIRTDLAPMLHLSTDSTGTRLAQGRAITEHPALAQLCVAGVISAAASRAILAETSHLSVEATATVVTAVVAKVKARRDSGAAGWTATELGQVTKRAVRALAADELEQARADAHADRRATVTPAGHGMAWLSFLIRDVDALRIYNRLTAQAQAAKADAKERDSGDGRTADQLRADIAAATLLGQGFSPADNSASADKSDDEAGADVAASTNADDGAGETGADVAAREDDTAGAVETDSEPHPEADLPAPGAVGPVPRPGRAEISVVVTLATLLGLADQCGQVPGIGPIAPDIARELASDGQWRLWITDPATGQVIATGARSYTPSAALARLLRAREPRCRMPGCNRQSVNCDLDHTVPWPGEPGTTQSNMGPLCRRHHNLKTHHGYHLANNHGPDPAPDTQPESWTWTMPSGLTHTRTSDPPLQE